MTTSEYRNRGYILLAHMGDILGEPVKLKSKERRFVLARTMVAYQLRSEGYTTLDAGRMMGKDHSTISYLTHKMKDALELDYAYKDIVYMWKQFQKLIQDDIHE